jgi:predicted  nucleic acid-binding Zn-ribbon protein
MKNVIYQLLELQQLELGITKFEGDTKKEIQRLRNLIPPQVIGHYDRMMAKGKKGVSVVRHKVCTECHMALASGVYAKLVRGDDIVICDTCGRYLIYLPEDQPEPETDQTPVIEAVKSQSKLNSDQKEKPKRKKKATKPTG